MRAFTRWTRDGFLTGATIFGAGRTASSDAGLAFGLAQPQPPTPLSTVLSIQS
jgi:hypothetical protein